MSVPKVDFIVIIDIEAWEARLFEWWRLLRHHTEQPKALESKTSCVVVTMHSQSNTMALTHAV